MSLQKYFSHASLVLYFFPTPPIKLKLGLQIGGRLLIATHLDQSNYLANQQQVLGFAMPFTTRSTEYKIAGPKPFAEPNQHAFDFSSSNFNLWGHILSTDRVALTERMQGSNASTVQLTRKPAQPLSIAIAVVSLSFTHDSTMRRCFTGSKNESLA